MTRASRAKKMKRIQPAVTDLVYRWRPTTPDQGAAGSQDQYIDIARDLSIVNRRGYEQNRMYAITGITVVYPEGGSSNFTLRAYTAGNSWVVQNAHVKGEALFHEMNDLVLKDNPSVRGTWAGFKVRLDDHHGTLNQLDPIDGDENDYLQGQWEYSTYVLPQHDVDPATGQPLPALERTAHLVGPNFGTRIGLVQAYADSRATVQPEDPSVPAGLSTSFFNLLTDTGSQEPELADVIQGDGDQPPYDQDAYPGGSSNADCTVLHGICAVSPQSPTSMIGGISVPCGLLHINGTVIEDHVTVIVHVAPGNYKGVLSVPMGQ